MFFANGRNLSLTFGWLVELEEVGGGGGVEGGGGCK